MPHYTAEQRCTNYEIVSRLWLTATNKGCWIVLVSQVVMFSCYHSQYGISVCTLTHYKVSVNVRNQSAANSLAIARPRRWAVLAFTLFAVVVDTLNEHQRWPDGINIRQWAGPSCNIRAATKLLKEVDNNVSSNNYFSLATVLSCDVRVDSYHVPDTTVDSGCPASI